MLETRRTFILGVAAAAALAADGALLYAQKPIIPPPPPEPAEKGNPADVHSDPAAAAAARRARLRQNETEFREGVERLYQLTSSLRDELQKTATTDVFSLHIVKQTEEIEKLAKLLKSKAKSA
jgi:phytoene dehydrogenase-like protein